MTQPRTLFLLVVISPLFLWSLTIPRAHADPPLSAQMHLDDARSLYNAGHWDEASRAFRQSYEIAGESSEIRAAAALEWSSLLWEQGDYLHAENLVTEAINLARELDLDHATGQLLLTLGHIEASKGDLPAAENTLNICVQLAGELNDVTSRSLCRLNRRMVRKLRGRDPGSANDFNADLQTLRSTEIPLSVGLSLAKTADLYRDANDLDRAQELLDMAQLAYESSGSIPAITRNRLRQVQLLHRRGDFSNAAQRLPSLLERFQEMGNQPLVIQTLSLQAEQFLHHGDLPQALTLYRRAITIANSIDNPQLRGRLDLAICELSIIHSLDHCQRAAETFLAADMPLLNIRATTATARALQQNGHLEEARIAYQSAIENLEATVDTTGPHALTHTLQLANLCQLETRLEAPGAFATCHNALSGFDALSDEITANHALLHAATTYAAGRAATSEGRGTSALTHLTTAAERYLAITPAQPLLAADVLLRLGHVQSRIDGHKNLPPNTFRRALSLIPLPDPASTPDPSLLTTRISLQTQLAQYHLSAGDWPEAITILTPLIAEASAIDDHPSAAWAYSALARAYLQTDHRNSAIQALQAGREHAESSQNPDLLQQFDDNLRNLTDPSD